MKRWHFISPAEHYLLYLFISNHPYPGTVRSTYLNTQRYSTSKTSGLAGRVPYSLGITHEGGYADDGIERRETRHGAGLTIPYRPQRRVVSHM